MLKNIQLLFFVFYFSSQLSYSQGFNNFLKSFELSELKKAQKSIEKKDYNKAIESLNKSLEKNPNNAGAKLMYAQLLSNESLSFYNLENAILFIKGAKTDFEYASPEVLKECNKVNITKETIENTFDEIRKKSYQLTLKTNTIGAYNQFLTTFSNAPQKDTILKKIDSISFVDAKLENSWEAYKVYLTKYPEGMYYDEAKTLYDKLLFESKTKDKSPESFETFLEKHPHSPYANIAFNAIFDKITLDNTPKVYLEFIKKYANSPHTSQAIKLFYHLSKKSFFLWDEIKKVNGYDSLKKLYELENIPLIPVYENKKIGFLDIGGKWQIKPKYSKIINKDAFCKIFKDDFFAFRDDSIVIFLNRNNQVFFETNFKVKEVVDLGLGIIFFKNDKKGKLIHKSGYILTQEEIQDAEMFNDRWIKIKKDDKWGIISFSGHSIIPTQYNSIEIMGKFYIFIKNGSHFISNQTLFSHEKNFDISSTYEFDDVELLTDDFLVGFTENKECLINANLEMVIPWGRHVIYNQSNINYAKERDSYTIFDNEIVKKLGSKIFDKLEINQNWLSVKTEKYQILNLQNKTIIGNLDSVKLINDYCVLTIENDKSTIHFAITEKSINIDKEHNITNLSYKSNDNKSNDFILLKKNKTNVIYDQQGIQVFEGEYDDIKLFNEFLFKVEKKSKQGLINFKGEIILPIKYNFIQNNKENKLVTILLNEKFGLFNLKTKEIIEPSYDANFNIIGKWIIANSKNMLGVINIKNDVIVPFKKEYLNFDYINDQNILVEIEAGWQIMNIKNEKIIIADIENYEKLLIENKNYFLIETKKGKGIINSDLKTIVPAIYDEVYVISEENSKSYIKAFKNFSEANFIISVGYDMNNSKIYSWAYRLEEFQQTVCDN